MPIHELVQAGTLTHAEAKALAIHASFGRVQNNALRRKIARRLDLEVARVLPDALHKAEQLGLIRRSKTSLVYVKPWAQALKQYPGEQPAPKVGVVEGLIRAGMLSANEARLLKEHASSGRGLTPRKLAQMDSAIMSAITTARTLNMLRDASGAANLRQEWREHFHAYQPPMPKPRPKAKPAAKRTDRRPRQKS